MDIATLTQELGIDKLPEEQQQEMTAQIIAMLQLRVNHRMSQSLSDEQQKHLEELEAAGNEEAVMAEIERLFPDYKEFVERELLDMRDELVGSRKHAQ